MKKLTLMIAIIVSMMFIPLGVNAKDKINVYFFEGDGCPHCKEAGEFFDSIKDEYEQYYNLVNYEVWYNEDNQKLMNKVAKKLGQEVNGVPYIIIGKKTWNGYSSDYDDDIKSAIKDEYEKSNDDRYDIMDYVKVNKEEKKSNDVLVLILILIITGGIVGTIIYARKKTF